jgi:hypothetical protein
LGWVKEFVGKGRVEGSTMARHPIWDVRDIVGERDEGRE